MMFDCLFYSDIGESINDANDRAIVRCALFFKQSLESFGEVFFITSDVGNKVNIKLYFIFNCNSLHREEQ